MSAVLDTQKAQLEMQVQGVQGVQASDLLLGPQKAVWRCRLRSEAEHRGRPHRLQQ